MSLFKILHESPQNQGLYPWASHPHCRYSFQPYCEEGAQIWEGESLSYWLPMSMANNAEVLNRWRSSLFGSLYQSHFPCGKSTSLESETMLHVSQGSILQRKNVIVTAAGDKLCLCNSLLASFGSSGRSSRMGTIHAAIVLSPHYKSICILLVCSYDFTAPFQYPSVLSCPSF